MVTVGTVRDAFNIVRFGLAGTDPSTCWLAAMVSMAPTGEHESWLSPALDA